MPVPELAYILVSDDAPAAAQPQPEGGGAAAAAAAPAAPAAPPALPQPPARYTPSLLRGTLQLMGAKPRHSERVARKAFLILQQRAALPPGEPLSLADRLVAAPGGRAGVALARPEFDRLLLDCLDAPELRPPAAAAAVEQLDAEGLPQEAANGVAVERQLQSGEQEQQVEEAAGQQDVQPQQDVPPQQDVQQPPQQQQPPQVQQSTLLQTPQPQPQPQDVQQPAQQQQQQHPQPAFTLEDLHVACSLREQRSSVAVLLCGTSGTGKSTLAALLAARLGISTVVSTDSIRHMMRSFSNEAEDPLLWASTYQAGAHLQQLATAQAAAAAAAAGARAAAPPAAGAAGGSADVQVAAAAGGLPPRPPQPLPPRAGPPLHPSTQRYALLPVAGMDARKAAVRGYKAQAARVLEHVERLLTGCEARRQSVVVEGVHLSLSMVVRLMQRHPSVVPFLVHISNEAKHMERFAVRSKVMTLRPDGNRYVKHFRNIRAIQDYLAKSADKHAIPKVDNTNVDRSVATIHATLLGCLRRTARGESVLASGPSLACKLLLEEYLRCQSATWSGRDMLELIRRKSAAGEAPSPSDLESTAATATAAASTPRGPLSEAAAEELHANGATGRGATPPLLRPGATCGEGHVGRAGGHSQQQQGRQQQQQQEAQQQRREEDEEGDNRSFYGSDSQSSSVGGTSRSCSSSSRSGSEAGSDGEEEHAAAAGCRPGAGVGSSPPYHANGARTDHDRQAQAVQRRHHQLADGEADSANGHVSDAGPGPLRRRQRQRGRRYRWRLGGGGADEIPAGPVPEQLRRRSDVGSVLEPDGQSEMDEVDLAIDR